ncbi:lipopolysaccharide-induced tumor necrosis factor-alpha factor homolog [Anguilla anguilla]|uniref:lipopolysaccharide-induced tumor necrosis factor-alpha factor homolog n=1 Tax=Anguilla anguilla TaxID=7936 RepID=UPI0015A9627E|nr:lipopolysaccharide-induced tumor necrosis factor-alpha factor homolog [Anguilla anguilla]
MATAPPLMDFPQPPSYEETMVTPPPPHYHLGPPPPQGYTSGPPPLQGYTSGPPPLQGYTSGPPPPQGYTSGPPPPPGYAKVPQCPYPPQPVGPPVTSPVVSVQTIYVQPGVAFGDRPVQVHCPACAQFVLSRMEYHSGTMTWLSCLALSFFGCIYGCCLIPFCADSLKDVKHCCPNCHNVLGVYRRL